MFPRMQRSVQTLAVILFAVHPVHVEAVAGIVGRAELMCCVFYLLALRTFFDMRKQQKTATQYLKLFAFTAAALLSKEIGVTVLVSFEEAVYDL